MSEESKQFWTKMKTFNKKAYDSGDNYYEFIASMIIIKVDLDARIAFSKYPDYFAEDALKYCNRMLMKFPGIWNYFEDSNYKANIKDKDKRKLYLYKILSKI